QFPQINGSEMYTLKNGNTLIDGPTFAEPTNGLAIMQRNLGAPPAINASSWTIRSASTANAKPGSDQTNTGDGRIYISQIADAAGANNFGFEFIEIFVE